jgi:hypothetical protein
MKFVLGWRHIQEIYWLDLHIKQLCLYHQQELQVGAAFIFMQDNCGQRNLRHILCSKSALRKLVF